MSDQARWTGELLSADLAAHAERICHAFETAWGAGQRPIIEDHLPGTPAAMRAVLFRALLRIDLAYRGRNNENPTPEEYRSRFPAEGDLIQAVFRETPTAAGTSPAGPSQNVALGTEDDNELAGDWPAIPGYEILGQLAAGGMGVVYQARQVGLKRSVALKLIRTGFQPGPQEVARFRVEAEAVASLSHPHIIQIHDCGEWNGMPYLAMEFAEGGSLARRLDNGPLPPSQAAKLLEILARAVQFVHEHGIIHRDLKPANVLLTDEGVPKLADFGLAKRLDQDQGLTAAHAVLGTASYMAPEQAAGDKHAIGPSADIYALGAILYEVLTGRPPFRAQTHELTIHQVLSEEPLPPRHRKADVPRELEAICLKCLEKEPGQRFASALALAEDLGRYQKGEPISIQSSGAFDWHARSARRIGYEILDILGAGVGGIVYKARHLSLNRTVFLEMVATQRPDPAQLERLRAETELVAQLRHPNIVELYDFGELNGEPFIASEYVEGSSLADGLLGPAQPAEQTAALVETLARAVHHAHLRGLVHGNLKPSKVLLGVDGACKISGFGLFDVLRPYACFSNYMAPEQAENQAEAIGPATDVYALGAILYELLTGSPPILADSVRATLDQLRLGTLAPPRHSRPEVPRELEAICLKCLNKEPASRYPSAAALAEDLRRFRTGEVLFIDDLDDPAQQRRWSRRAGYEILELLGQGPDGFTYKARQLGLDRMVVLRRVTAQHRFVPAAKDRFRWEARLLARLRHPNIVQLYDQGEHNDLPYFAREFVDGPSLGEIATETLIRASRHHAPQGEGGEGIARKAAELVATLALAIQAAHAEGIVHGGLNPGNVYLTPAGVPKITNFRRARLPGSDSDSTRPDTEIRRLACYLAPEQLAGRRRDVNRATDVYALGAILYTMLTGRPPFLGQTLQETLAQVQLQVPLPCRHWQPGIPPELETICLQCLQKQPSLRPASAELLADGLRNAVR